MENRAAVLLVGSIAGALGYYTYTVADVPSALVVVFASAWLIYRFSSSKKAWDSLSFLTNPPVAGAMFFLGGFSYFALNGTPFEISLGLAIGIGLIGVVAGIVFYNYWNIA